MSNLAPLPCDLGPPEPPMTEEEASSRALDEQLAREALAKEQNKPCEHMRAAVKAMNVVSITYTGCGCCSYTEILCSVCDKEVELDPEEPWWRKGV